MKRFFPLLVALAILGCKPDAKKQETSTPETETTKTPETAKYVLADAETSVNFTAYKTTKKVGVKGVFKKVEITNDCKGNSIKDAMNEAEFQIPVNSIETNDSSRNFKIIQFFFKTMENTMTMTGKIHLKDETNGTIDFTMNGITEKLPFTYTITDNVFSMKSTMNTDIWKGQEAIAKLNEACKDLHKGADGVSKTWNVDDIEVTSTIK